MRHFADDTTIILDGTEDSLQGALNVLEIFTNISGLKVNTEKTQIIWIWKKKGVNDKLNVKKNYTEVAIAFRFSVYFFHLA